MRENPCNMCLNIKTFVMTDGESVNIIHWSLQALRLDVAAAETPWLEEFSQKLVFALCRAA
jgi:hypothetical protein